MPLPSGGHIVIDRSEALWSIDVNSGRSSKDRDIEDTAFRTNGEAAAEVTRQLRLRDIGGLIVIDFIDMESKSHNKEVERILKDGLKRDKAKSDVTSLGKFGLVAISRQRMGTSFYDILLKGCDLCGGTGVIPTQDAATVRLLRRLHDELSKEGREAGNEVSVRVAPGLLETLLNQKRDDINRLEKLCGGKVAFHADPALSASSFSHRKRDGEVACATHPEPMSGPTGGEPFRRIARRYFRVALFYLALGLLLGAGMLWFGNDNFQFLHGHMLLVGMGLFAAYGAGFWWIAGRADAQPLPGVTPALASAQFWLANVGLPGMLARFGAAGRAGAGPDRRPLRVHRGRRRHPLRRPPFPRPQVEAHPRTGTNRRTGTFLRTPVEVGHMWSSQERPCSTVPEKRPLRGAFAFPAPAAWYMRSSGWKPFSRGEQTDDCTDGTSG